MYSYTNRSRKVVSTITLMAIIASQLSFLTLSDASSLTFSDYSATLITPNQGVTQSVTTMTIASGAVDTDTLILDGCTITFQDFGTGDTDCTDGAGRIDTIANGFVASQATALAGFIFSNYVSSAGSSGKFILTHTGAAIDGNISSTESGTLIVSDVNTVVGSANPIAQVVHFIPVNPTVGETYRTTIDGVIYDHLVSSPETIAQTVTAITASLSTNTGATCTDSTTYVACTALTGGVAYTYAALPVDEIAPTLYLTAPTYTNTGFILIANFFEPVYANGDTSRFVITNGNTGSALTMIGSGVYNPANGNTYSTGYSLIINPITDGIVTVQTLNQPGVDVGGNESASGGLISIIYDSTRPSVTLATIPGGLTTTTGAFTIRASFSEDVSSISSGSFVLTNAIISDPSLYATGVYLATVTPTNQGIVTVRIPAGLVTDIATNTNTASNILSLNVPDTIGPVVTLSGASSMMMTQGNTYTDMGATWTDNVDGTGVVMTASSGSVDTNTPGVYTLEYTHTDIATNTGNTVTRTVTVTSGVDTTPPVVTLAGSGTLTLQYGSLYTESGASWTDNFDGMGIIATASSGSVDTSTLGTYILSYTYTDMAGNSGNTVTRTVTVVDQIAPVVTLSGASTLTLIQNDPYTESGASWTDNRDGSGSILVATSGSVDTSTLGTYILSYTYTDMAGNSGNTVTRTVTVGPPPPDTTPPVVTLIGSTSRTIMIGTPYTDLGARWTDNRDGSGSVLGGTYGSTGSFQSTGSVDTATAGTYTIDYTKVDLAGNIHTSTRTVTVMPLPPDTTLPVVTLIGSASMIITQSGVYTELGASWTDDRDGSGYTLSGIYGDPGSFQSSGSVNTFLTGVYTIDYTKVDLAGNTHTLSRTITVLTLPPIVVQPIPVVPLSGGGGGGASQSFPSISQKGVLPIAPTILQTGALNSAPTDTVGMSSRLKRKLLRALTSTRSTDRSMSSSTTLDPYLTAAPSFDVSSDQGIITLDTNSVPGATDNPIEIGGLYSVNQPRVNMRIAPSLDARILGYLTRRDVIKALSENNGWVEFQLGTLTGWVKKSLITLIAK